MRRRVTIALSTVGNPELIVFDEPTTGLDPETRHHIWNFFNKIKHKGITIILSTHILEEADTLCGRIAIMNEGKLVAAATSTELKNRFGKGFRLNLNLKNCTEESNRSIVELIRSKMKEIELLDNLSGYVISFVAKVSLITELRDLLRFLEDTSLQNEEESALLSNIENLSLSNSSLEEVFMELTSEEKQTNQRN